jgi:Arm DNA-binding domain
LTARAVATATKPGLHADGGGLYLRVGRVGAKSWALRFMIAGKAREMGFGGLANVSLAEARRTAADYRPQLANKVDPIARRDAAQHAQKIEDARSMTFDDCARAYVKAHEAGWRNAKHRQQWTNTLKTYASPVLGSVPVSAVDVALVTKVLDPIWTKKPETAGRVRGARSIMEVCAVDRHDRAPCQQNRSFRP